MFGLTGLRLGVAIALALAVAGFVAWAFRVDHLRAYWHDRYVTETGTVNASIANAIGNPDLKWKDVSQQVDRYAKGHAELQRQTIAANATINAMGAEAARLKRLNADMRAKADKAIAQRQTAIDRLARQALDPGERENCQQQIAAAQAALDLIYEEGL